MSWAPQVITDSGQWAGNRLRFARDDTRLRNDIERPLSVLLSTILRPPGDGPFPLLIMNHGTTMSAMQRADFPMLEFEAAALWFVNQGFVVVAPQRTGHGETGGLFFESQRLCEVANFRAAGLAAAGNIQATINYMLTQSFVRQSNVVVLGQSAGGWSSLALASLNPPTVRAVIDFVGRSRRSFRRQTEQQLPT